MTNKSAIYKKAEVSNLAAGASGSAITATLAVLAQSLLSKNPTKSSMLTAGLFGGILGIPVGLLAKLYLKDLKTPLSQLIKQHGLFYSGFGTSWSGIGQLSPYKKSLQLNRSMTLKTGQFFGDFTRSQIPISNYSIGSTAFRLVTPTAIGATSLGWSPFDKLKGDSWLKSNKQAKRDYIKNVIMSLRSAARIAGKQFNLSDAMAMKKRLLKNELVASNINPAVKYKGKKMYGRPLLKGLGINALLGIIDQAYNRFSDKGAYRTIED